MVPALLPRLTTALRPRRPTVARAVAGLTFGFVVAAVVFAFRFGSNVAPVGDEWYLIQPLLTDGLRFGWVIEHHNEHRYPLAKLLWAGSLLATGYSFRAGMLLSVGLLAAAATALLAAARRLRGRPHVADLILPALVLHWGHAFALLMGYQVAFTMVVAAAAGLLYQAARVEPGRELRAGLWAGVFLLLLVPNGGFGLGFAGPVAAWVAYLGWRRWAAGGPGRWRALAVLICPAAAIGYATFVWRTTPPPLGSPLPRPGPLDVPAAFVGNLEIGFGTAVATSAAARVLAGVVAVAAYLAAAGLALRAARRDPAERPRAFGLLAVLAGQAVVSAGLAWYRGGALSDRFVTPSAVGLAACWLALARYGPRVPGAAGVVLGLAAAGGVYGMNLGRGYDFGMRHWLFLKGFLADCRAGELPPLALAGKYGGQWIVYDPHGELIDGLRAAGRGPFAAVPPNPPLVPHAVPLPAGAEYPLWWGGVPAPVVHVPDPPGRVWGLTVRVRQRHDYVWQRLVLRWDDADGPREADVLPPLWTGWEHDLVFWVGGGRPRNARLESLCPTFGYDLGRVEWLTRGE